MSCRYKMNLSRAKINLVYLVNKMGERRRPGEECKASTDRPKWATCLPYFDRAYAYSALYAISKNKFQWIANLLDLFLCLHEQGDAFGWGV